MKCIRLTKFGKECKNEQRLEGMCLQHYWQSKRSDKSVMKKREIFKTKKQESQEFSSDQTDVLELCE